VLRSEYVGSDNVRRWLMAFLYRNVVGVLLLLTSRLPCLLKSPGFFSRKFQDLESPGKSLWSWKVLEIKA